MANTLVGFGSVDGLGSSCGCYGSRKAGMAGLGTGPDGLGAGPDGLGDAAGAAAAEITQAIIVRSLVIASVWSVTGYFIGGAIGRRAKNSSLVAVGAMSGAATALLSGVGFLIYQSIAQSGTAPVEYTFRDPGKVQVPGGRPPGPIQMPGKW